MLKRIYSLFIAIILLIIPLQSEAKVYKKSSAVFEKNIKVSINDDNTALKIVTVDGNVYLPLNTISYALNSNVSLDNDKKTVRIDTKSTKSTVLNPNELKNFGGKKTAEFIDDMKVFVNKNNAPNIEKQICTIGGTTFMPLKALTLLTDIRVRYDEKKSRVNIVNPKLMKTEKKVSDRDKKYYVYDLPLIRDESDFLIGNWKGIGNLKANAEFDKYNVRIIDTFHVTRQNDGKYTVIQHSTFDEVVWQNGRYLDVKDIASDETKNHFIKYFKNKGFVLKYTGVEFNTHTKELELGSDKCEILKNDTGLNIKGANKGPKLHEEYLKADYKENGVYVRY